MPQQSQSSHRSISWRQPEASFHDGYLLPPRFIQAHTLLFIQLSKHLTMQFSGTMCPYSLLMHIYAYILYDYSLILWSIENTKTNQLFIKCPYLLLPRGPLLLTRHIPSHLQYRISRLLIHYTDSYRGKKEHTHTIVSEEIDGGRPARDDCDHSVSYARREWGPTVWRCSLKPVSVGSYLAIHFNGI